MDDFDHQIHHAQVPCPACGEAVHVVVSRPVDRSRWVCLACKSWGTGPILDLRRGEDRAELDGPASAT